MPSGNTSGLQSNAVANDAIRKAGSMSAEYENGGE